MTIRDELLSSVVSIVPFIIEEYKPGLYPGNFIIPPSKDGIPEILLVGESIHYVEVDPDKSIPVTNSSHKVATAIVEDYINSQLAVRTGEANICGPGIFWKIGKYDLNRLYTECSAELVSARQKQQIWFTRLVEMADDDWEKTRQHKAITDMQRFAAKALKLERPWAVEIQSQVLVSQTCPACGNSVMSGVVVCGVCKCIINMAEYKKLSFAGATK